jgi:DNA-3-methyladenine glycosylase II
LSDADIMNALMQVKGIGRWTAEMILIFKLGRQDIMPVADLGVQKGYAIIFKLKERPLPKAILQRSQLWKPYRSTATLHCWQALDTQT